MTHYLVVFSAALLLFSGWLMVTVHLDMRRHLPPRLADWHSSRYFTQYILFDRSIPLKIRRRLAASTVLSLLAVAGFAVVAYLGGNLVIAVMLVLVCGFGAANVLSQWRTAKRQRSSG